jgi:hypothetical protein
MRGGARNLAPASGHRAPAADTAVSSRRNAQSELGSIAKTTDGWRCSPDCDRVPASSDGLKLTIPLAVCNNSPFA